jgi:hypothetical protein
MFTTVTGSGLNLNALLRNFRASSLVNRNQTPVPTDFWAPMRSQYHLQCRNPIISEWRVLTRRRKDGKDSNHWRCTSLSTSPSSAQWPDPSTTCNAVPPLLQSGESWLGEGKTEKTVTIEGALHCQQVLQVPTDQIPVPPAMPYPHYFRVASPD